MTIVGDVARPVMSDLLADHEMTCGLANGPQRRPICLTVRMAGLTGRHIAAETETVVIVRCQTAVFH